MRIKIGTMELQVMKSE